MHWGLIDFKRGATLVWVACVATGIIRKHIPTWLSFIKDLMEGVQAVSAPAGGL